MSIAKNIKSGIFQGIGILIVIGISGVAYGAYVSISDVAPNDTLTASTFNQVLANIDSLNTTVSGLSGTVSGLSGNYTTLAGTVSGLSNVPAGAVMAFNLSSCPTGWIAANGSNSTPDLRGEFIRGLDGGRGVDSGRTLSSFQAQDWKGFYQHNTGQNTTVYSHGPVYMGKSTSSYVGNLFVGGWSAPAAAMGTMWDTSEIRPRNVALLYCVKQ
ncbi:MAG: hypothetical protein PHS49_00650 [Candidatus Gracilibacteria bacterium]|nr:hypothetical protein [Candidatus Gracilibacteria bacterium]